MELLVHSPETLGSALTRQRKAKKLSQTEAGAPFKIEQSTLSNIENGTPGTRLETLFRVLAALDLEMVIRTRAAPSKQNDENW
jgi:HTH-type transcriptional regulator/antitoxin HipB